MKKLVCSAMFAAIAASGMIPAAAVEPNPAAQPLDPTQIQEAGEKVQSITFVQDDAQFNIVSKVYELKHTTASDLAPFVKSAVIRFDPVSTVSRLEDKANGRQLLIISTAQDMMPYVDEMVTALDRPGTMNSFGTVISGTGIAYGTYLPQFRASTGMKRVISGAQISSGPLDSRIRLDRKTNMFYFKDTPSRVEEIRQKLAWLDKEIPQARIELTVYEVRDSDLTDIGIDYLAWKNGPGLNLFEAGYEAMSINAAESLFDQLTQTGIDLFGNFSYGFGGIYTAPAFDFSFIRILQQNGKAVVGGTAGILVSNRPDAEFKVAFSPEYQNIVKNEDHQSSVEIGGSAALEAVISNAVITGGRDGVVNFTCSLAGSNVVERNNLGAEISESTVTATSAVLDYKNEKLLAGWQRTAKVEQTIGIPFLCELPVLKYIFGTTTENLETTRYFVTARAVPVTIHDDVAPGMLTEFDELANR
ncbi:MAG: hypothetical protein AB7F40_10470 [Victivallaceae bacterium]|nr:hypothetical protein [Victivallaceae bacterium]